MSDEIDDMMARVLLAGVSSERLVDYFQNQPLQASPAMSIASPPRTDATYRAEYVQLQARYQKLGITEADYISSRRIDDGVAMLVPGSGATEQTPEAKPLGADPVNAKYVNEYAAHSAHFQRQGITESDYIASCRITDGLDELKVSNR